MTGNAAVLFSALVQSLPLPMLLLIFVTLFLTAHQTIYVGFYRQQFPHVITGLPVLAIGCFLFRKKLGILSLQFPYGGQLFQVQLVKGFLGSFMKQNFCLKYSCGFGIFGDAKMKRGLTLRLLNSSTTK